MLLESGTDALDSPVTAWVLVGAAMTVLAVAASVRIVPERERVVVTRMGRTVRVTGPGLVLRIPGIERWGTVSTQPHAMSRHRFMIGRNGMKCN